MESPIPPPTPINVNQIVAANLRRAREDVGLTQTQIAAQLAAITGRTHTKATISAMERSATGGKRREFDAHQLAQFALLFGLPVAWFMTAPVEYQDEPLDHLGGKTGAYLETLTSGPDLTIGPRRIAAITKALTAAETALGSIRRALTGQP